MKSGGWLGMVGSTLAIVMPKGVCPLCVAASSTIVSALGLGFAARESVMRWWLAVMLLGGLYAFAARARSVRRWGALLAAIAGSALVYFGWLAAAKPALYAGMTVLAAASIANWRMKASQARSTCHVSG